MKESWIGRNWKLSITIYIVITVLFPLLVNLLSQFEAPYKILEFPSEWLSFWGTYISAVTSLGMIIITALSIHRNSEESKANRRLQCNVIKYENQQAWIIQLKSAITLSCNNLSFSIENEFIERSNKHLNLTYKDIVSKAFDAANKSKFQLCTVLIGRNRPEEIDFVNKLDFYTNRFFDYLFDLEFFHSLSFDITSDILKEAVEQYKTKKKTNGKTSHRIWAIIESKGYSTENMSYYLNTLVKEYHFEEFEAACINLIQFEETLANKILNGTEQDK